MSGSLNLKKLTVYAQQLISRTYSRRPSQATGLVSLVHLQIYFKKKQQQSPALVFHQFYLLLF